MATLSSKAGAVTLLDWAKSVDPDGKTATVVELLNQSNEILTDMLWIEGNLPTGQRASIRTGLPTSIWRKMYQGVPASKSLRATIEDACGMLETRAEVDKDVVELNGNTDSFRLSEAQAFLESLNQTMAETVIYGDASVNPEQFNGLKIRYDTLSGTIGQNVISAGGAGSDNTSVYLVGWGRNTVTGIFPKGSMAGLQHENLGLIDAFDSNNNRYRAYADHWQWKCGLHVKDWRYVVRIANIDLSDLTGLTGTQAITAATFLPKLMIKAMARFPFMGMCTPVFYASRTVKEMLSIGAMDKNQNVLSLQAGAREFGNVSPGSVSSGNLSLLGVPIRTVDRLRETEAVVS
jgi:hypothetical protein